jgi:mannose-6-phosphate isomerase-like protein (cupin superfamily)
VLPNGVAVVFKVWGEREAGDHDVSEHHLAPGFPGPRPHVHQKHEEIFYVLEGEIAFLVGKRAVQLGAGSVAHIPPGVVHDFRTAGSGPARCLVITSPSGLDRYFEELAALVTAGTFDDKARNELRLKYDTEEVDVAWDT